MSHATRHNVTVTTDISGDGTAYSEVVTGKVNAIIYTKTDYADGVDFVVTAESTGQIIWDEDNVNASVVRAPRQATHSTVGVAALYAAGGTAVNDKIAVAKDRIKIVVASGGASKTGTFTIVME